MTMTKMCLKQPTFILLSFFICFSDSKSCFALEKIKFEKVKIQVGSKIINVELADNNEKAAQGLMYRKNINSNEGMLFVFPDEQTRSFWMKNTFIDLSIGFFDKNKVLIDIQEMKAVQSEMVVDLPSYISKKPAKFALEMNANWYKKNQIVLGTKLKFLN